MTMNSAQRHEIVSGDEQYRCVGDGKCFDDVFESSPLNANIVAVSTVYIMLTTCNHCLPIISVAYYYYAHGVATNAHTLCPKQIRSHAIIFGNCFSKQKTFVVVGIIQFWRRKKEIKRKQNFNFFSSLSHKCLSHFESYIACTDTADVGWSVTRHWMRTN